ncbi:MAG: LPP20 family lipoprotein [Campylobacterales bacterium]|nr:LPP20 family lipoprotein [Campylobacterales bacterium]
MKKSIGSIFLAAAMAATFAGCADKAAGVSAEEKADFRCRINNVLAPEWACGNESVEGAITAVGSAPMSKLGEGFSRREAIANGRSNLAQQIQTLVKDKVETFSRSTGVGGDEVADKVSTQVSKQVAQVTLNGSKQIKRWQDPTNNDIYVLIGVDEGAMNQEIKNSVKSSYKNDNALWQQFQSKQALESLDKEFPTN